MPYNGPSTLDIACSSLTREECTEILNGLGRTVTDDDALTVLHRAIKQSVLAGDLSQRDVIKMFEAKLPLNLVYNG
jgi:hypothetical protein